MLSRGQFENEKMYQYTMAIVRNMRKQGLITGNEYSEIDTIFLKKYRPVLGSLYSEMT